MRKLKLQVQISVDGYIAGPNHEMDWIIMDMDPELLKFISDLNRNIDCILLGRNLAEGFIPHWKTEATDETKKRDFVKTMSSDTYDFARKMHETKKVVFTKSLKTHDWENTELADGDLVETVNKLKSEPGGDIIVYGGAKLVSSLIRENLIDEFNLFINPSAIGKGLSIFADISVQIDFTITEVKKFDCGVTLLKLIRR